MEELYESITANIKKPQSNGKVAIFYAVQQVQGKQLIEIKLRITI